MEHLPAVEEFFTPLNLGLAAGIGAIFSISSGDNKLMAFLRYAILVFILAPIVKSVLL
jgi:hypothetical protein